MVGILQVADENVETITANFSDECPVFNQDKWYADPWDVLMRCSGFVSESEGKYGQIVRLILHFSL